jgi:DNA-binding CsgD family transcriptional regulator
MNAIAEAMMPRHFTVSGGRLLLRDREAVAQVDRRIAALMKGDPAVASSPVVLHAVPHDGVLPSLCYVITPPEDWRGHPASRVGAIALIVDPASSRAPVEQLSALFKLTTGQARIAARLAEGLTLAAAAAACGISKETARNHLKAVFSKTGTARQSELVALLAHLLPIPSKP